MASYTPSSPNRYNKYIIRLKDDVSKIEHITSIQGSSQEQNIRVTHGDWNAVVFNGYGATLSDQGLQQILARTDVAEVYNDNIVSVFAQRDNVPWGLQRISQRGRIPPPADPNELTFTYAGKNGIQPGEVHVYIVDTGIYTDHSDFNGRARWGFTAPGYENADGNGHGTHVAGTAGGANYGVGPDVRLFAVKVLSDDGSGWTTDIISGLSWVFEQKLETRAPSIVNMSLGGDASDALDGAVLNLTRDGGIHVVVAAGNSADLAENYSPARAPSAITVAASNIDDEMAWFSNYGSAVDIFAPGVKVISASIRGPNETDIFSGTSMAAPHVAGLIGYLISLEGDRPPGEMRNRIQQLATNGALDRIDDPNTVNLLAYNGGP